LLTVQSGRSLPSGISTQSVRAELEAVLGSRFFVRAPQLSRFLRFIVEQALEDGEVKLKEYLIATEVFDRSESFDPRTHPIVRVEANRLRAKLREYYFSDGSEDPIEIQLPAGCYVPSFRERFDGAPVMPVAGPNGVGKSVAIRPFASVGKWSESFSLGFAEELINALDQLHSLRVLVWNAGVPSNIKSANGREAARHLNVYAILDGSIRKSQNTLRLSARLIRVDDGTLLWSQIFERPIKGIVGVQQEISRDIAHAVGARTESSLERRLAKAPAAKHLVSA
jgi:TolB-like protein